MPYIGSQPTKVVSQQSSRVYRYTATAGQTVFSGADVDNQVLNVTPSDVEVHMNGLLLDATDYTVTSSSVTLGTAANAGDELTVTGMVTFEVADTYDKTTADARYVNASGDTMTGALTITETSNQALNLTTTGLGSQVVYQSSSTNTPWYTGISGNANDDFLIYQGATANAGDIYMYTNSYERMRIDSAGRVTMPYQPAFDVALDSGSITGSAGGVVVVYQQVLINEGGHYSTSTGKFTAPITGTYEFYWGGIKDGVSGVTRAVLYVNGSAVRECRLAEGDLYNSTILKMLRKLTAGDYVEIRITGGTYYGSTGFYGNCFGGRLVG